MTTRRPWTLSPARRPLLTLLLTLVSGGATAGFAGYYLKPALSGYSNCHFAGGPGCPAHPFWGLSPELYLAACLLGVGSGVLLIAVGGLAFAGLLSARRAGYGLVALSAIGVIAYGGLGVGTVAGVLAGTLILRSRTGRASAPSEWSGSLPTGVPPVLHAPKRPLTGRPPVTEWDGILAAAPAGPPGKGRYRVFLPTADRLSAALEKSRVAGSRPVGGVSSPPPVVFLPPPPVGLRGTLRPPGATASLAPSAPLGPSPLAATSAPAAAAVAPTPGAAPPTRRGLREVPELVAWNAPTSTAPSGRVGAVSPPAYSSGAPPPARPSLGRPPFPGSPLASTPAVGPPAPPRVAPSRPPEQGLPALGEAAAAPEPSRMFSVASRPAPAGPPTPPAAALSSTAAPGTTSRAYLSGPLRSPLPRTTAPSPAPAAPVAAVPTPSPVPSVGGEPVVNRPPPPAGPLPKERTRPWKCPSCGLLNAPWSPRCTNCKAEPAGAGTR